MHLQEGALASLRLCDMGEQALLSAPWMDIRATATATSTSLLPGKLLVLTCTSGPLCTQKAIAGIVAKDILLVWECGSAGLDSLFKHFPSALPGLHYGFSAGHILWFRATDVFSQVSSGMDLHLCLCSLLLWVNSQRKSLSQDTVTRQLKFF